MFYILALVLIVFFLATAIRILKEYERGVIFRLGRVIKAKGTGLIILIPIIDTMVKVSFPNRYDDPFISGNCLALCRLDEHIPSLRKTPVVFPQQPFNGLHYDLAGGLGIPRPYLPNKIRADRFSDYLLELFPGATAYLFR